MHIEIHPPTNTPTHPHTHTPTHPHTQVMAVQKLSTAAGGLGADLLAPHPLCYRAPPPPAGEAAKRKRESGKGERRVALCVPAVDCCVTLQDSGVWVSICR